MIKCFVFFFLLCTIGASAQEKYIIFNDSPPFDTVKIGTFKLLNHHVKLLIDSQNKHTFNILNLYFSKYNFKTNGLDRKAFYLAKDDFNKIENDVLITMTPLTDSLDQKMLKVDIERVKQLNVVKPEELLQTAIRNLYYCFTENEISSGEIPGVVKSMKYKLLIKKRERYYLVNVPILTEYYLIDKQSYLFPTQYHYGEINVADRGQTTYFTGSDIDSILHKTTSGTINGYYPIRTIARRTYLSNEEKFKDYSIYTYWNYPLYSGGPPGIGRFQFIESIGVVNGTYGNFFYKKFLITLENNKFLEDHNGPFRMTIKDINGITFEEYVKRMHKIIDPQKIIPD